MSSVIDFLITCGPAGMFLSAFWAGSVLPMSSEAVLLALLETGLPPVTLLLCATAGNVLGGLVNYGLGSLGKEEWITRYAKVPPEKMQRGMRYVTRYGAWAGLLAWLPVLGSIITVAMGFGRTNLPLSVCTIALGKYLRYQIIVSTWLAATSP